MALFLTPTIQDKSKRIFKNKTNEQDKRNRLINTENRLWITMEEWGMGELGELQVIR